MKKLFKAVTDFFKKIKDKIKFPKFGKQQTA